MKSILLFLLLLAGVAPCVGQAVPPAGVEAPAPFKGANTILIHTPDSAGVALKKLGRLLVADGFTMDKVDTELGYLTTVGKPHGENGLVPATFAYKAVAAPETGGTVLHITGEITMFIQQGRPQRTPMFWAKTVRGYGPQCFSGAEKVALAYPGARLGYVKTP